MANFVFFQNIYYECQGPMSISAVLKANGYSCKAVIGSKEKVFINALAELEPDIVGFSSLTGNHKWDLKIARLVKENSNAITVFGGPHPTIYPEIIENEAVDIVCCGEGEMTMLQLARAIDRGEDYKKIKNLIVKNGREIYKNEMDSLLDIDTLPHYDRNIYKDYENYFKNKPIVVQTDRYCPYKCSFCLISVFSETYKGLGRFYRVRAIDSVIKELHEIKKKYPGRPIHIGAESFNANEKWFFEFLDRYSKEIKLPFICLVVANRLTEEQVIALKNANCEWVSFSPETGNEALRRNVLRKNLTNEEIYRAGELLHKHGLKFMTGSMLGLPGETLKQAFETLQMNIKLKPLVARVSILTPYPKLFIEKYALEHGYLEKSDPDCIPNTVQRESLFKQKDINKIVNLQRFFAITVKFPLLLPVVKKLVHLPKNIFFDLIFLSTNAILYFKNSFNLNFVQLIIFSLKNAKFYFNREK